MIHQNKLKSDKTKKKIKILKNSKTPTVKTKNKKNYKCDKTTNVTKPRM